MLSEKFSSLAFTMTLQILKQYKSFGGMVTQATHQSVATKTPMRFSVYIPPGASESAKVPVLYYLSGLTCTDENFIQKAGAQRAAAQHGIALIAPDTSPRGANAPGEDDGWDFGTGAGFYLDATEPGFAENYNMYQYITEELPSVVQSSFPALDTSKASITGHSMGGHGALTIALKNPTKYRSVSAFAPICHPSACPWGVKALSGYLGSTDTEKATKWPEYDATALMQSRGPLPATYPPILIDQGAGDNFYTDGQLLPEDFVAACQGKDQAVELRLQEGYDHSYFFIASFVEDHVAMAAKALKEG